MIIGSMGDMFAAQRLALEAAAIAAAKQKQIDTPTISLAKLNVIGFGRTQAAGGNVPAPLQQTSVANPTSASAPGASSSKTPLLIGAAVLGLVALLAIAKKKKR